MKTVALEIESEVAAVKPDYKPLARTLLDEIRSFYTDPENEAEFQRWLAERNERREKECS